MGSLLDDKYEILSLIGVGGMGEVYKARHIHLHAFRCIKVMKRELLSDEAFRSRFLREARVATQIQHSNVAALHDFSTLKDGSFYMVSEFIDGITIRQWGAEHGRFPLDTALEIMLQVLAGLAYCHRRGLLHRDISADNIMISRDAEDLLVKIIDLGIAKIQTSTTATTSTVTQVGLFVGNPKYSSPEQLGELDEGEELDGRADLYSLGVVLYEMLLGVPLFKSRTPQGYIVKHLMQAPTPFTEVDPSLEGFDDVEAMLFIVLSKNRKDRYANAKDFAAAVRKCLADRKDGATVSSAPRVTRHPVLVSRTEESPIQDLPLVSHPSAEGTIVKEIPRLFSADQKQWEQASRTDTMDAYRAFIDQYPASPRAAQARSRLDHLLIDQIQQFEDAGDLANIEGMIALHAEGTRVGDSALAAQVRLMDAVARRDAERNDWSVAEERATAEGWRWYLGAHPASARNDDAERALAEAVAFETACAVNDFAAFKTFLEVWPGDRHAAGAAERIARLRNDQEESDYRAAIATASVEEIETFLAAYPESGLRKAAEQAIIELNEFAAASATDREEQWSVFLQRWPRGLTALRAKARLQVHLDERAELDTATRAGTPAAFQAFIEKYPGGKLSAIARDHLREAIAFVQAPADGISGWNRFLENYPDGLHFAAAERERTKAIDQFELDRAMGDDTPAAWHRFLDKKIHDSGIRQRGERRLLELEDSAFRLVKEMQSPDRIEPFLQTFPSSGRAAELQLLAEEWERKRNQAASVARFLDHPPSDGDGIQFAEVADREIETLVRNAEAQDKIEHLDYLAARLTRPRVKAAAAAAKRVRKKLDRIAKDDQQRWTKAASAATSAAWREFIARYPQHPRASEAAQMMNDAQAFERVDAANSIPAFRNFLAANPAQPWRAKAEKRLTDLQAKSGLSSETVRKPVPDANQIETQVLKIPRDLRRTLEQRINADGTTDLVPFPDSAGEADPLSDARTVPATKPEARGVRPLLIAGMAVVVIAILAATWFLTRPKVEPSGPAIATAEPSAPLLAPLIIDAHPWAEIVSIKTKDGVELPASDGAKRFTPMSVLVTPGDYTVTLSNPSTPKPQVLTATVKQSGGSCEAQFPGIDVNEYFKQAGWK
jgi:serine/threonine protein kinase